MSNKPTGQHGTFQGIQVFSKSSFSGDDEFLYKVRGYGDLLLDEELESLSFIHAGELVEMKVNTIEKKGEMTK